MTKIPPTDDWHIDIAVEDNFLILGLNKANGMLPSAELLQGFIAATSKLRENYHAVLDLGGMEVVTSDVLEFVDLWTDQGANVIVGHDQHGLIDQWPTKYPPLITIQRRNWTFSQISLAHFADIDERRAYDLEDQVKQTVKLAGSALPTYEEWELARRGPIVEEAFETYTQYRDHYDAEYENMRYIGDESGTMYFVGARAIERQVQTIGKNSLMTQIALVPGAIGDISAVPYHGHALFESLSGAPTEKVILTRPSRLASRTQAIFAEEFNLFSSLLSNSRSSENDFQDFFERHPVFLKMLGYKSIYPSVVLERDDGSYLKPDFMLEPFDGEFWDILDIKKPNPKIIVGQRDRKDFSHQVHQLAAQLREYGSYFDEERHRKRIKDKYGILSYKPRLIGMIGDECDIEDKLQLRRVMTQYVDTKIVTFDTIRQIAKDRLLI